MGRSCVMLLMERMSVEPRLYNSWRSLIPGFPEYQVAVKYATEHRCGVRLRGPELSDRITGTDPLKDNLPLRNCQPMGANDIGDAEKTSALMNALSKHFSQVLSGHPVNQHRREQGKSIANVVLFRGCGTLLDLPSMQERHPWLFSEPASDRATPRKSPSSDRLTPRNAFAIAPTCMIAGFAQTLGMEVLRVPGATGDYHTNLRAKGEAAVEALRREEFAFGFLHIKAVDDAGHDSRVDIKCDFLRRIDAMLGEIMTNWSAPDGEQEDLLLVLTGDHSTPVTYGDHSHEPVPFMVCSINRAIQASQSRKATAPCDTAFSEISAARGCLGRFPGSECFQVIRQAKEYFSA